MNMPLELIQHTDRVFTIPGFLTEEECRKFVEQAESQGFEAAGVRTVDGQKMMPYIRNNDRLATVNKEWASGLWRRLVQVSLPLVDGRHPAGLASLFRFYRYVPGQRFKMHKDGGLTEGAFTSKLSFLIYLNSGFDGGETDFRTFKISPETGLCLLFVHDTWHEGTALTNGTKYVLRSDVLYE